MNTNLSKDPKNGWVEANTHTRYSNLIINSFGGIQPIGQK